MAFQLSSHPVDGELLDTVSQRCALYEVWQKINATDFLLTMNFILFTNQSYPFQNSSFGQLHSGGGVVCIVLSSAGRLLLEYLSARRLLSKEPKLRPDKWFLSRGNKKKSQGLRSDEYGADEPQECFFSAKNSLMETAV
jgi:hypothetical protein